MAYGPESNGPFPGPPSYFTRQCFALTATLAKYLPGVVRWFRFSGISWTKDSKGFFYAAPSRAPCRQGARVRAKGPPGLVPPRRHRAGPGPAIYWRKELPRYFAGAEITDDGRYLIITLNNGTDPKNRLFYADLGDPKHPNIAAPVVAIVDEDIAELSVIGSKGPLFYVRTDLDAPNRRIIAIDPRQRINRAGWKSIVPESKNALESATMAGDRLFAQYLVDVKADVRIFSLSGKNEGAIDLPGIASVRGMSGRQSVRELFYTVASPLIAPTVYRYDIAARHSAAFAASKPAFDPSPYETRQVFYTSKDGTSIPMFITGRKDLVQDGSNAAWLYGYGGFSVSITPSYRISLPAWLEMGGIYVQPALRGGAEYGEEWHRAGKLRRSRTCSTTSSARPSTSYGKIRVIVEARDRGRFQRGLTRRRVMTQRPDLFAVAIPEVGCSTCSAMTCSPVGRPGPSSTAGAESGPVSVPDALFATAEREAWHLLSGNTRRHGGPRRPRRTEPLVQVRRCAPGRAGLRKTGADPRRDAGESRLQPDRQADRGARRCAFLHGQPGGSQVPGKSAQSWGLRGGAKEHCCFWDRPRRSLRFAFTTPAVPADCSSTRPGRIDVAVRPRGGIRGRLRDFS